MTNKFKETVEQFENDESLEVNIFTSKLEQKTRNKVKGALVSSMLDSLNETFEGTGVRFTRVEKGIGMEFPTPKGSFAATIEITMKSTDIDFAAMNQEYLEKLSVKETKRAERAAANAEKAKADEIKREIKRAERAAKALRKQEREARGEQE